MLQQTYSNWEYILVNNCSTDRSVEIAEHYVRLHPGRLRLEHNAVFVSQVQNYNQALRLISARSKYCKVVQADDVIFPQCLELMVDAAERDSSIGVVGAYSIEGRTVEFDGLPYPSLVVTGRSVCRMFFVEDFYVFGSATQLLIRSDLVLGRTPFYDESYVPFEDAAVVFQLLAHCSFGFVHQVLTFSRRDNTSVMKSLMALDCSIAFQLLMLREFGLVCLGPSEFQEQLRRKERAYAQVLVNGLVALRRWEFWSFHRTMLRRMRYRFGSVRVWWMLFLALCNVVLNPKNGLAVFARSLRREVRRWTGRESCLPSYSGATGTATTRRSE